MPELIYVPILFGKDDSPYIVDADFDLKPLKSTGSLTIVGGREIAYLCCVGVVLSKKPRRGRLRVRFRDGSTRYVRRDPDMRRHSVLGVPEWTKSVC